MQAKTKRFTIVTLAVGLCLILLVGSALALNVSYQQVSMPDPYGVAPLNLNADDLTRTISFNGRLRYGANSPSSNTELITSYSTIFEDYDNAVTLCSLAVASSTGTFLGGAAGSYFDFVAPFSADLNSVSSLIFGGGGSGACVSVVPFLTNQGTNSLVKYFTSVQVLVNGLPVGSPVSCSADGSFTLNDISVSLTDNVTSVGLRFYFDSGFSLSDAGSSVNTSGYFFLNFYFTDNVSIVPVAVQDTDYVPYFERTIGWLQSIFSAVNPLHSDLNQILDSLGNLTNLSEMVSGIQTIITPSDEDQTSVDEFDQQIQDQISEADKIQDTMESLDTPPPAEIVPDVSTIVTSEDAAVYSDAIGGLFQNSIITNMLLISLSICFVSYVLFGKK